MKDKIIKSIIIAFFQTLLLIGSVKMLVYVVTISSELTITIMIVVNATIIFLVTESYDRFNKP